ncbi:unnamed protein product [Cercopithifilaria johnstoni]|uniref:Uncharacterized protein n=1 Tax=Cercopithifilaria johnstoni TaxID=2874296 RepID=A0A8J2LYZ7_9BILA|nr:unnamed protein product [Cercopithifilaria johnstoni]
MGLVNIANELICNQTLRYLRCENGNYIPLLNLKRNWSMYELWSDLFHKCLNMELYTWDELIDMLARGTDTSIRENGDQWIKSTAEYNVLFRELFKKSSQFYP